MMVMRKKNPLTLTYRDYFNSKDFYKMTYEEWKKKDHWEDTNICDNCGTYKGSAYICPKCKL